ncbi:hypothetical protein [Xanthobacter agilis]|uniref:Uncharacterized protein n=1 Tax=Xanthobacter agilis TaxID=47492 RepID=A0ABU0LJ56_XANAG|nr:hypothetical protein [Xanthobacter agilis]MDQ0507168.1 hypothetical protein [Xanthobacter agilis]
MTRIDHRLLRAAVLAAALPAAAAAAPVDDYMASRDKAVTAAVAAAKAGKAGDDAEIKAEEVARKDLAKRMSALVGPLKFKGLGTPSFTLDMFVYGDDLPATRLDGMAFANADETTRVVATPEAVFQAWLAARAKDKDVPEAAAVREGGRAAVDTGYLVNNALVNVGGGVVPYTALPVTAAPGETVYANLGLFTDEAPANALPNTIVLLRVADGRAVMGMTAVALNMKPVLACDQAWKPYNTKVQALLKATETVSDLEDPRWAELAKVEEEGSNVFRTCLAKAPESQAAFATATKRAEAFLQTLRGN